MNLCSLVGDIYAPFSLVRTAHPTLLGEGGPAGPPLQKHRTASISTGSEILHTLSSYLSTQNGPTGTLSGRHFARAGRGRNKVITPISIKVRRFIRLLLCPALSHAEERKATE